MRLLCQQSLILILISYGSSVWICFCWKIVLEAYWIYVSRPFSFFFVPALRLLTGSSFLILRHRVGSVASSGFRLISPSSIYRHGLQAAAIAAPSLSNRFFLLEASRNFFLISANLADCTLSIWSCILSYSFFPWDPMYVCNQSHVKYVCMYVISC